MRVAADTDTNPEIAGTVSVRIKHGVINGRRQSYESRDVDVWLGIPYAQPPIGELRFRKPLPVRQPWEQPLEATQWPPACYQVKIHQDYYNTNMSEDCLYLNIWSPSGHPLQAQEPILKPVMLWIHGGGLAFGSASEHFYDGRVLSALGDVVVVTINYRLGVFGMMYTGSDGPAPGNMIFWDQSLAMEWVRDNIRYFGGDPHRVTLFGESAGGVSVGLHLVSPVTRHLYQNAIVMSGAPFIDRFLTTRDELEATWVRGVRRLGCRDNNNDDQDTFTPELIQCLIRQPADKLVTLYGLLGDKTGSLLNIIIDGEFLPRNPRHMFSDGDYKRGVNLMIGGVEDEGSMVLGMADPHRYDKWAPAPITGQQVLADFQTIIPWFTIDAPHIDTDSTIKHYFHGLTDPSAIRCRAGVAIGDLFLTCPTILMAKAVHRGDPTARVYHYHYTAKMGDPKLFASSWMTGAGHFDDIYPVFGVPLVDEHRYVDGERLVSRQMIGIFSEFAHNGSPRSQGGAEWHPYYTVGDNVIAPYFEITGDTPVATNYGNNLKEIECELKF
ncbi:unnamed protein product [Medioppia subpectinata]|uniref:Carboxylic ester hydrolase n=1 Tax=Medioppia subpectinata TaxID=1979941 RepID=A0A7R9Q9L5_9ACAR|nr:unnamed protein product [Medioppia subpectinata]CAG2116502.1 unnamed protein product [Medioppia subpectinata]